MEPADLSSLPLGGNSFLLIHYPNNGSTIVPRCFVRDFPEFRQLQNVIVSDPMDNDFIIKVRSEPRNVLFVDGFQSIRQTHNIGDTVRVHYTYNGAGHFNIRIFYDESTEVNYQLLADDAPDEDGEFAFLKVLTKPMVKERQTMSIPASYVNNNLKHHPSSLNIIYPDESLQQWSLNWAEGRPWQCVFGTGWYEFAKDQCLRARDELVFYKMPQADTYKVVIHRH